MIGAGLPIAVAALRSAMAGDSGLGRRLPDHRRLCCRSPASSRLSGGQLAALAICIAGGSIVLSHVNDAGSCCRQIHRRQRTANAENPTVMETILGGVGGAIGMIAFTMF